MKTRQKLYDIHPDPAATRTPPTPQVLPSPSIVDRTLRFYCAERDLAKQHVPLHTQPPSTAAAATPFAAAARHPQRVAWQQSGGGGQHALLAVAASHPDVSVALQAVAASAGGGPGTGDGRGGGAAGGTGAQEVVIKYKCGASPEVAHFHVWLYADGHMARPVEVWQVRRGGLGKPQHQGAGC